jgi:hypothetical protein
MEFSKLQRVCSMNSYMIIIDEFGRMWTEVMITTYPIKHPVGLQKIVKSLKHCIHSPG